MDYNIIIDLQDLPNEIWKDSPFGIRGHYQISSFGRVKRNYRVELMKNGRYRRVKEMIMKARKGKWGYYYLNLSIASKVLITKKIHSLVAYTFIDNTNNKPCINHKNGIKTDNRVENLEWVTYAENSAHALETGLANPCRGERHKATKFKEVDVAYIRANKSKSVPELMAMFSVCNKTIYNVLNKVTWAHV